jgi:hypothetical protein
VQPGSQEFLTPAEAAGPLLVKEVLARFGRVRLRVQGLSMAPAVLPGDVLEVRSAGADGLVIGSLVLVDRADRLIAHRLIARGAGLLTRGDARWRCDPPVDHRDVLGVVDSVIRDGSPQPVPAPCGLLRATAWRLGIGVWRAAARLAFHPPPRAGGSGAPWRDVSPEPPGEGGPPGRSQVQKSSGAARQVRQLQNGERLEPAQVAGRAAAAAPGANDTCL